MGQFIVLDLEWNQSPAGKEGSMNRLPFEIIEIGAVKLNKNLQIISEFRRLIRPRVYRQMHYKISEVTHMSIEQLDTEGEDFVRAMTEFLEWCGDDYRFCTWGSMDLTELQRNMVYHGMELQFPSPLLYYDLQKIYALIHGTKQKESLDTVVEELHLTEDRPFHRALDDAYYTGRVMSEMDFYSMMEYVSVDYYQPQNMQNLCRVSMRRRKRFWRNGVWRRWFVTNAAGPCGKRSAGFPQTRNFTSVWRSARSTVI